MDPFALFASYPTLPIGPDAWLERGSAGDEEIARLRGLAMMSFATAVLPVPDQIDRLLRATANGAVQVKTILTPLTPQERPSAVRALAWLAKLGAIRVRR
jgi:hypothetical protein